MHCLANFCYVCLEKKDKLLSNINSSSINKDIIHIIGYLPFNLAWLKTLQIVLICEECCLRLRDMYQFQAKCLKNSSLLQSYRDNLNASSISNTETVAELLVKLNIIHNKMNVGKYEIQSENEEICTFQPESTIEGMEDVPVTFTDLLVKEEIICKEQVDDEPDNNSTEIIEETEDVFVNLEDYFVKEENKWKREEVDDPEEYPMDDNSTEIIDNESDLEISINDNTQVTNTDCLNSQQAHTANKNYLNTAAKKSYKCSTCSKSFFTKSDFNIQKQIHTDQKPYECAICKTGFSRKANLVIHMRIHTGKQPYSFLRCNKCFSVKSNIVSRTRIDTGEKPYVCFKCKKCFTYRSRLMTHMRIHTGEKPYSCTRCKKCFSSKSYLARHMRIHTGEKPYKCSKCKKCYTQHPHLVRHMLTHTDEKPYNCSKCKKYFTQHSHLVSHMRVHTGEKPYECL